MLLLTIIAILGLFFIFEFDFFAMDYFPILIDLRKFNAVVIGGGEVATRKVKNLLEFGACPVIIAPDVTDELKELILRNNLEHKPRKYNKGDLNGFNLVFVATDSPEIDNEILEEAKQTGCIVNFADQPELCNFIVPSFIKRGELVISISTQGKVPFLSRFVRECLEEKFPPSFTQFVELSKILRNKLKQDNVRGEMKEKIIDEFLAIKWVEIIEDEGFDYALILLNDFLETYVGKK